MSAGRQGERQAQGASLPGGARAAGGARPGAGAARRAGRWSFSLVAGVVIVAALLAIFAASLFWTPYDPDAMQPTQRFAAASLAHPFGTDQYGRDIASRVMAATHSALAVGLGSVLLGAAVGTLVGCAAALSRGVTRAVLMRLVDGLMAFPGVLLALMLVLVMGRGLAGALVAIATFMVPTFARLAYSLAMEELGSTWAKAARSYGCSGMRLMCAQLLPCMAPRIVTQLSSAVGGAMLLESSLSFLGLGVQPPTASWGMMLNEALRYVTSYPGVAVAPGLALMLAVLGFNLLGDGLNDRLVRGGSR